MSRIRDLRAGSRGEATGSGFANGTSGTDPDWERGIGRVLVESLAYARDRDYTGWDYGDAMSSRLVRAVPVDRKWPNIAVQQLVKRSPVNLRPLLLVEQRRNFMGAALFAMANLTAGRLHDGAGEESGVDHPPSYREEAHELLDWLGDQDSGYSGFGLGHPHEIQDLQGKAEVNEPDSVVTSVAVRALLRGADLDPSYPEVARTAADFVVEDLDYRQTEHGARITYSQNHPGRYYTLNAGALGGRLFLDLYDHFGDAEYLERGTAILDHVVAKQEACGGWMYRDPPEASHLSMDTHHNGFVLECLLRHREVTGSDRYDDAIDAALAFHRDRLFEANGAPNWDESDAYPKDVHAAAQGILIFTYAGDRAFARRILEWTLANLYDPDAGRFHFRKHRLYTDRTTLMRWCQAWMAYAISEFLVRGTGQKG